jgi:isopentenyl diphosphate isomerase/L-lactate dehydrogenase-like FMN-dependent dehydrogenase
VRSGEDVMRALALGANAAFAGIVPVGGSRARR